MYKVDGELISINKPTFIWLRQINNSLNNAFKAQTVIYETVNN